jgi:hypothetical protein
MKAGCHAPVRPDADHYAFKMAVSGLAGKRAASAMRHPSQNV